MEAITCGRYCKTFHFSHARVRREETADTRHTRKEVKSEKRKRFVLDFVKIFVPETRHVFPITRHVFPKNRHVFLKTRRFSLFNF